MLDWLLAGRSYSSFGPVGLQQGMRADARNAADSAVQPLEHRIESLELACAGMWELLKFKMGCTDEELVAAVQAVDARDGKVDGKLTAQAGEVCPKCGRKLLARAATRCSWCGEPLTRIPF